MKRITYFVLILTLVISIFVLPSSADNSYSHTIENCYNFIDSSNGQYAISDYYYNYDNFVDQLNDNEAFDAFEVVMSATSELSCEPTADDYMEALSNVISLQDVQNASRPSAQQALDDLKEPADYLSDFQDLCIDGLSLYVDLNGSDLEQKVTDITNTVLDKAELSSEHIMGLNNLYSQISEYAAYDHYLSQIEENSDGDLKKAAQMMRGTVFSLLEYTLDDMIYSYSEMGDVALWNVDESIFSNIDGLIDSLAEETDLEFMSAVQTLKDCYSLGADGALLWGNMLLGTENTTDRVRELIALKEIADASTAAILDLQIEFLLAYENGRATEEMVKKYTDIIDHLYDTHRRGEYCLYSMLKDDMGLLSDLFAPEDLDLWYEKISAFIRDKEWFLNMIPAGPEALATHHYYVFDGVASTWEEAEAYCESLGGHLATIGSKYENDLVYSIVVESGYKSAYFGLTDKGSEGVWRTVNGEPLIFSNWGGSEPNNERYKEHYAMFYYKFTDGSWNDGDFGNGTVSGGTAFVCEWEVDPDTVDINSLLPKS